ncbi:MAG: thioesterase family protein [Burkholderiales bacterium]
MPRLQIDLPETFTFSTEIPLYTWHINSGGHLDNAQLGSIISETRARFFQTLGYGLRDLGGPDIGMVVADAAYIYKTEAFYGEVMVVNMTARDLSRCGCDLVFLVTDRATGREVARGKCGVVFVDRTIGRPTGIPPKLLAQLT